MTAEDNDWIAKSTTIESLNRMKKLTLQSDTKKGGIQIKVSVIIVNYNGRHHLDECLMSLSKQTFRDFEIIVVDNGSIDDSVGFVKRKFPDVILIVLDKNEGFCRGNNIGLRHAKGDYIALLNNDTFVDSRWIEELYNGIRKHSDIGFCSSCILNYYARNLLDTAGDGYDFCGVGFKIGEGRPVSEFQTERYIFGACAGAVLYRRSMIDKIGFFDEKYFAYGEDLDLSFRAALAGYKCLYVPRAVVYHKINQTLGKNSKMLLYYTRRNVEYTYIKNMPIQLMFLTLPLHLLYNVLTFVQSLMQKQSTTFLKSKMDFFRNFRSIYRERIVIQSERRIPVHRLFGKFSREYLNNKIRLNLDTLPQQRK